MRYGQIQWFTVNGALFIPGIIARQNRQRRTHFQYDVASIIRLQKCDIYFPENVLQIAKIMSIHRFSRNEKKKLYLINTHRAIGNIFAQRIPRGRCAATD